jgi:hypothetical protein|tara:strand:+ start:302 stop:481 length:180 start_codon:yes stop_codon:yes gene_type:complete
MFANVSKCVEEEEDVEEDVDVGEAEDAEEDGEDEDKEEDVNDIRSCRNSDTEISWNFPT